MRLPKNKFDCVVVGAGPGGSTCAYEAARRGLDVLLLDKRQSIGEPVRCGEGFGLPAFAKFGIPIDARYCTNKIVGFKLVSPGGHEIVYRGPRSGGYILERFLFDKALAVKAGKTGATVLSNARATGVERDGEEVVVGVDFMGERGKVRADIVVGADGRESNVGRWMGIDTSLKLKEIAKGFQYDMLTPIGAPELLEIHIGKEVAPGGYIWIFPKGPNRANIGVGVDGDDPRTAKHYLDKFMEENEIRGSVLQHVSGTIPLKPPSHPVHADNMMLVGDAARFVNPMHGGGITEAMDSGRKAGEVASLAASVNDFSASSLEVYSVELGKVIKELEILERFKEVVVSMEDDELDFIVGNTDGDFINDITEGKGKRKAIELLMKKPKLLRFLPKMR